MSALKIVVFGNHKGGTGKTTASQIFACFTSVVLNKKTLMIDCDPQGNLSRRYAGASRTKDNLGYAPPCHPDILKEIDLMIAAGEIKEEDKERYYEFSSAGDIFGDPNGPTDAPVEVFPYPTVIPNLSIIPADSKAFEAINQNLNPEYTKAVPKHFATFLALPEIANDYEVVIIDTPPNKYAITRGAVRAATDCIIVVRPELKSIEGLSDMWSLLDEENLDKPAKSKTKVTGILINGYSYNMRSTHDKELDNLYKNHMGGEQHLAFGTALSQRSELLKMDYDNADPTNPFMLPQSNETRKECLALCEEIADRLFGE